jgi:hypothetical protein
MLIPLYIMYISIVLTFDKSFKCLEVVQVALLWRWRDFDLSNSPTWNQDLVYGPEWTHVRYFSKGSARCEKIIKARIEFEMESMFSSNCDSVVDIIHTYYKKN